MPQGKGLKFCLILLLAVLYTTNWYGSITVGHCIDMAVAESGKANASKEALNLHMMPTHSIPVCFSSKKLVIRKDAAHVAGRGM